MDWEYELTYPPRRGFTRAAVRIHNTIFTSYESGSLGSAFVRRDPFHAPTATYYWEPARLALLPSAEQYAIRKRTNAPTD